MFFFLKIGLQLAHLHLVTLFFPLIDNGCGCLFSGLSSFCVSCAWFLLHCVSMYGACVVLLANAAVGGRQNVALHVTNC